MTFEPVHVIPPVKREPAINVALVNVVFWRVHSDEPLQPPY